MHISLI